MSLAPGALIPRPRFLTRPCAAHALPRLQSYFQQAGTSALNDPLLMQAQVPFRQTGLPMMPGGFPTQVRSISTISSARGGRLC